MRYSSTESPWNFLFNSKPKLYRYDYSAFYIVECEDGLPKDQLLRLSYEEWSKIENAKNVKKYYKGK